MKGLLGYAALGGVVGVANAKALKWSAGDEKRWSPPQETLGFMPALGMNFMLATDTPAPAPTSPPVIPDGVLERRATSDNTCGYVGGKRTNSMWCPTSQFCAFNSINSHIGCCDDTSTNGCNVWTTCLKSADASKYTTDNGLTLWCGFSDYPNCLTHIYADDSQAKGYTLLGCGIAAGTDKIYITALDTSASSSSPFFKTDTSETTTPTGTRTSGFFGGGSDRTSTPTPTPQPSSSSSSVPIGPIVGGAVGGVVALALIAAGIFFLVRTNNKSKANIAPATAPATATAAAAVPPSGGGPGPGAQGPPPPISPSGTPGMAQHGGYYDPTGAGFAHLDPRASIAKPPYGYDQQGISPPGSPPPPAQQSPGPVFNATPSPPPPPQGYPQQGGYPQQQQGAYSPQGQYPPQTVAAYAHSSGQYSPQQQQQPGQGYPQPPPPQGYGQQQQYQGYNQPQQPQQFVAELPTQRGDGEVRELAA